MEKLCIIHNHLSNYEWDNVLGEMPDMTFEEKKSFFSELYHRIDYLIQNIGETTANWYYFKNNLNKSFSEWLDFKLNRSTDTPWYKYYNQHHSPLKRFLYRKATAPWRYIDYE